MAKKPRDYKSEYLAYGGKPQHIKERAARNAARAEMMKEGKAKVGDGLDASHRRAIDRGGTAKDGIFMQAAAKNRSFRRDAKRNLVSETSLRERKKKK